MRYREILEPATVGSITVAQAERAARLASRTVSGPKKRSKSPTSGKKISRRGAKSRSKSSNPR